jgi:HSP20 family protein
MRCMTQCGPKTQFRSQNQNVPEQNVPDQNRTIEDQQTLTPRIDILDRTDAILLYADMPGVSPNDVDVKFENGELSIHGKRAADNRKGVKYFRNFTVSEQIATDRITAEMKNGVLALNLPKVEAFKPRKIPVVG